MTTREFGNVWRWRLYLWSARSLHPPPALPKLRASPPTGAGWLYELKFDGYHVRLHKAGLASSIYGKKGGDFTRQFPDIAAAVLGLPTKSCVIV